MLFSVGVIEISMAIRFEPTVATLRKMLCFLGYHHPEQQNLRISLMTESFVRPNSTKRSVSAARRCFLIPQDVYILCPFLASSRSSFRQMPFSKGRDALGGTANQPSDQSTFASCIRFDILHVLSALASAFICCFILSSCD